MPEQIVFEEARDKCERYGFLGRLDNEDYLRVLYARVKTQVVGSGGNMNVRPKFILSEIKLKWNFYLPRSLNTNNLQKLAETEGADETHNIIALAIMLLMRNLGLLDWGEMISGT